MQAFKLTAICTIKLHYAVFHVAHQMAVVGLLFGFQEYWIERLVGDFKSYGEHVTRNSEIASVNVLLQKFARMLTRY